MLLGPMLLDIQVVADEIKMIKLKYKNLALL